MRMIMLGITAAAVAVGGCTEARSQDGGPTVERNFQVGNFDRIELAGSYDTSVRTGSAPSVHATGNEKLMERLVVEVRNGVLSIHPKKTNGFSSGPHRGKVQLTVTVPALRGAELAGSGDLKIDRIAGESFDGSIAGSGNLHVGRLEVGTLKLSIAGSGNVEAVGGRAQQAQYDVAGSGAINAGGVQTETTAVSIAGSGDVSAHAAKTAAVSIMGSGDVAVTGGAKCTVSKAGSGQARCS